MKNKFIIFGNKKLPAADSEDNSLSENSGAVSNSGNQPGGVLCQGSTFKIVDVTPGNLEQAGKTLEALKRAGLPLSLVAKGLEEGHGSEVEISLVDTTLASVDPIEAVFIEPNKVAGYQIQDFPETLKQRLLAGDSSDLVESAIVKANALPTQVINQDIKLMEIVVVEGRKIPDLIEENIPAAEDQPVIETSSYSSNNDFLGIDTSKFWGVKDKKVG